MNRVFRLYFAAVLASAAACLALASWAVPDDSAKFWNAIAVFSVVCFVSEAYYFRLRVGRSETGSSIAFISHIASFLLFDTGWAASIVAASMFGVEFGVRRKPVHKILFNTAQVVLSVGLASVFFKLLGGTPSIELASFRMPPLALGAGVATYFLVNSSAVSFAVTFGQGEPLRAAWVRIAGASLLYDLFSAPVGALLAYLYLRLQIPGILILVFPILFIRHIYHVNLQLEQVNRDLLELMVKAIEARDPYTSGHSKRVSELAAALAKQLGLGAKQIDQIRTAALLHDVGKIHEEYAPLLRKEGKLDPTEKALMQTHSMRSAELVATISGFRGAITDAVRHHHENYDGTGYPTGLAGRAIPVGARIIMIADTVDAMTTDRPYRGALSFDRVAHELARFSGKQFDPQLVAAFMESTMIREQIAERAGKSIEIATETETAPWRRPASRPHLARRA